MIAKPASGPLNEGGGRRRFPGVRSFEEKDASQFFGREAVVEELLLRVLSVRLLLQFAPSGVGKTSVLQAGLFPALRQHGYFPISVRLNQTEEPLTAAVRRSLAEASTAYGLKDPVIPPDTESASELLAATQLWNSELSLLRPVLVFDQFEEVFTQHDEHFREEVARELGSLVALRARTEAATAEAPASIKVIISLREEFLGRLEDFSADIPDLFSERLRLAPLSQDEARQAIVNPARMGGDGWASPQFEFEPSCLDELLDFIDGSSERYRVIEPLTLQLVCRHAEAQAMANTAIGDAVRTITLADFGGTGGLKKLVSNYYDLEVGKLPDRASRRRARSMLEQGLLDPAGKRLMLEEGEIQRNHGVGRDTLDVLVEGKLLRREPRNESLFYEISHDRLAEAIVHQRGIQLPKWFWPVSLASSVAFCALIGFGFLLASERAKAIAEKNNAEVQRATAEKAYGLLLGSTLVARLNESGYNDALKSVLDSIDAKSPPSSVPGLPPEALKLRHQGDLLLGVATLGEARRAFEQALAKLELPAGSQETEPQAFTVERARLQSRLGDIAVDARDLALAQTHFDASAKLWALVLAGRPTPMERLDAVELYRNRAALAQQLGDLIQAEDHVAAATELVVEVWLLSLAEARDEETTRSFEQGRAMQLLADVTLTGASIEGETDRMKAAVMLAQEAVRMRPLSAQAIRIVATAIANRASAGGEGTDKDMPKQLDEATRQIERLMRLDPGQLRMRREYAAIRLVKAAQTVQRDGSEKKKSGRSEALRHAQAEALEATGEMRWLASHDPDNKSLREDVGWALGVSANLQAEAGNSEAAIRMYDAAVDAYRTARVGTIDYLNHTWAADLMNKKAELLARDHPGDRAKAAMDAAVKEVEALPATTAGTLRLRAYVRDQNDKVLRGLGLTPQAAKQGPVEAGLLSRLETLQKERRKSAEAANLEAVRLNKGALASLDTEAQLRDRRKAIALYLQAIKDQPQNVTYWENLSNEMSWIKVWFDKGLGGSQPASPQATSISPLIIKMTSSGEFAMRFQVAAATVAHALSRSDPTRKASAHDRLYEAQRDLALHLFRSKKYELAGALARDGLLFARELMADEQSLSPLPAEALGELRDAYYGVGLTRFESKAQGWEEPTRLALQYGETLARSASKDAAEHLIWLGTAQAELGQMLQDQDRIDDASVAFRSAAKSCREALARGASDEKANAGCLDKIPAEFR